MKPVKDRKGKSRKESEMDLEGEDSRDEPEPDSKDSKDSAAEGSSKILQSYKKTRRQTKEAKTKPQKKK